jgi:hypothetical protein
MFSYFKKIAFSLLFLFFSIITFSQNRNSFDKINWIIGKWKVDDNIYEEWKNLNDTTFVGINYYLNNENDTIVNDYISIACSKGIIVYKAKVIGHNHGNVVEFKLTNTSNNNSLIFENKEHDFPNVITYKYISKNTLKVSVEGKNKKTEFNFIRIN